MYPVSDGILLHGVRGAISYSMYNVHSGNLQPGRPTVHDVSQWNVHRSHRERGLYHL